MKNVVGCDLTAVATTFFYGLNFKIIQPIAQHLDEFLWDDQ